MKFLVGLLIILNLSSCGNSNSQFQSELKSLETRSSIINGLPVPEKSPENFSTVALYYPRDEATGEISNFCTGTLISPDVVMTAGHCFVDFAQQVSASPEELTQNVLIAFGSQVTTSNSDPHIIFRHITRFIAHPEYKAGQLGPNTHVAIKDIALVRLEQPAPSGFLPASLVSDLTVLKNGLNITLVGFGLLSIEPVKRATQIMEVQVNVDNPTYSASQFSYKTVNGKSACAGDSGGPAYIPSANGQMNIIGITSWGDHQCRQMGIYTAVPPLVPWIQSALKTF